ncbi:MAG TPA: hypothetical protein VIL98_03630 [Gaiellaceae bacterium]
MRRTSRKVIFIAILSGILASAAYAFTAANTVPGTQAGSGSGTISGYTATAVTYTLNATTPTNIDAVAFTISPTTTAAVKIQLAAAGTWYSCTNTAGSVSCTTTSPQATVVAATQLSVVAVQ